jgi:hypothetical protein
MVRCLLHVKSGFEVCPSWHPALEPGRPIAGLVGERGGHQFIVCNGQETKP